ncbi:MAG TPA: hypothetical protein PJ997_03010 [Candidatus Paceibacterota bacterium]|nr:hypothetical protein [Candidatus Paceibacterota bacterium]
MAFIIILILFLGFLFRIYNLGENSLWIDEGYSINATLSILEKGVPILESGEKYIGWITTNYIMALQIKLFGFDPFNPWSARFPSVIFGLLTILIVFYTSHLFFKNYFISILSVFIISFDFWQIAWSGQARGYTALSFLILLSILSFWKFWINFKSKDKKYKKYLLLFIINTIFLYYTSSLSLILLPGLFFWIIFDLITNKEIKKNGKFFILFFTPIFSVLFFEIIKKYSNLEINYAYLTYFNFLYDNYLYLIVFSILGILFAIFDQQNSNKILYLFFVSSLPILIIIQYSHLTHIRYIFPFMASFTIIYSYSFFRLSELISNKFQEKIFLNLIIFLISITLIWPSLIFSRENNKILEFGSPQPDFKNAYKIIRDNLKDNEVVTSPYTHLNKIYLGDGGFWLPISLTGRKNDLDKLIIKKDNNFLEYYTGSQILFYDKIDEFIETHSGYIIIDQMAKNRLGNVIKIIENNPKTEIIWQSKKGKLNNIWLYKF